MNKIKIREIKKSDLNKVCEMIDAIFNSYDRVSAKKEIIFNVTAKEMNLLKGAHHWLAEINRQPIALTGLVETPGRIFWMSWLGVKKKYRDMGIGSKLLRFTINKANIMRAKKLCIECGTFKMFSKANNMYKKSGFKKLISIKNYWQKGDHLVIMSLNLSKRKIIT